MAEKPRLRWEWGGSFERRVLDVIREHGPVGLREIGEWIEKTEPDEGPVSTGATASAVSALLEGGEICRVGEDPVRYRVSG